MQASSSSLQLAEAHKFTEAQSERKGSKTPWNLGPLIKEMQTVLPSSTPLGGLTPIVTMSPSIIRSTQLLVVSLTLN